MKKLVCVFFVMSFYLFTSNRIKRFLPTQQSHLVMHLLDRRTRKTMNMKNAIILFVILSTLFVFEACEGIGRDTYEVNLVDGSYFQDTGEVFHFSDTCFFSQKYHPSHSWKGQYNDYVELSCQFWEDRRYASYCIYIAIPRDSYTIKDNQVILPAHCPVMVDFLRLSNDLVGIPSFYSAKARFRSSSLPYYSTEDGNINPCKIDMKLTLDGGGVLNLSFDRVMNGSVYRLQKGKR